MSKLINEHIKSASVAKPDAGYLSFGFNIIGHVSSNLGLGVAARCLVQTLSRNDIPLSIYDVDSGEGRWKHDLRFRDQTEDSIEKLPYSINLFIFPPPALVKALWEYSDLVRRKHCLNVALSFWELDVLPQIWQKPLHFYDAFLAPSKFIETSLSRNLPEITTIPMIFPMDIPANVKPCRDRFNLPKDKVLFIASFEPHSDPSRKNPFAVIDAFKAAMKSEAKSHLVIKLNNGGLNQGFDSVLSNLQKHCKDDPRIHIINESLTYADVLNLYACCDVFVSLHRSEGLGLGLMEAMSLGKPVIATAYSGNMSFMSDDNSCLVGYRLVSVDGSIRYYKKKYVTAKALWAEPAIHEASAWMRKLADHPELRKQIGQKAATAMAAYNANAKRAEFVMQLQEFMTQRKTMNGKQEKKYPDLRKLQAVIHDYDLPFFKKAISRINRCLDRYLLWRLNRR